MHHHNPACQGQRKYEVGVKCQIKHLQASSNLERTKSELLHLFKDKKPTPEQVNDLLTFRSVGKREFETRVEYDILRNASVKPPKHQKRLLAENQREKRCLISRERENCKLNVGRREWSMPAKLVNS